MVLTVLKILAGVAVVGLVATLLIAVISGLASTVGALKKGSRERDEP